MSEPLEADRVEGAPHPRDTVDLIGQQKAETEFLTAYNAGRLHHAWLLTGPRGVGKATLAWRIARFLLATAPSGGLFDAPDVIETLEIAPEHPVRARVAALSEPGLKIVRRAWDAKKDVLKTQITVEEIRDLKTFFHLSSTDGGRRLAILDSADEMNVSAANAILKLLEEPPPDVTFLLISHQPARLLPTIRSRCREIRLSPLDAGGMARAMEAASIQPDHPEYLAELAAGSVGEAIRLSNLDGLTLYQNLVGLFSPRLNRPAAIKMAEGMVGRANEPKYDVLLRLIDLFLARAARASLQGIPPEAAPGEAELLKRLAPHPDVAREWAGLHEALGQRLRHGKAVNLDPTALILDTLIKIDKTAAEISAR